MSTAGKRALVTGGSAGLGAACVRWLRAHDFHVVSLDRNPAPSGDTGQIGDSSPSHYLHCDLSDRAQLDAALGGMIAEGPFDLVVLNAGISATGRFEAIGLASHLDVLRVNTEAPMVIAARLLQAQALRPGAAMVFVSSLSHFTGYPGAASYAASKDALAVFARGMRKVAKARGVSITVAFPGPLRTHHAEQHAPKGSDANKRMDPDKAAHAILTAALAGRKTVVPGLPNRIFAILGRIAPKPVTALMHWLIYKRLTS
jgi:short-subunit dehydrogenase